MKRPDFRSRQGIAAAVGATILVTVLAAFVLPPGVRVADAATDGPGGLARDLPAAVPEDLSRFVDSERWGVSLADVLAEVAAENLARRGLNPELRRMGFLGLIETRDATAVLIADPDLDDGDIIELAPGDTLPDGRVLTAVTDNSITLSRGSEDAADAEAGARRQVLLLFPRGEPDPADGGDA